MMKGVDCARIVADFEKRDVRLSIEAGKLVVDAPEGALTPADLERLRALKPHLLAYLGQRQAADRKLKFPLLARQIIRGFSRYGFRLAVVDGQLRTTPLPFPDPAPPGLCRLARLFKEHRDDVIQLLQSQEFKETFPFDTPNEPDLPELVVVPNLLDRIIDAMVLSPDRQDLIDMALPIFVRYDIEARRIFERLPITVRDEVLVYCREFGDQIVAAIASQDYQQACDLMAALPNKISTFVSQ